jgi:acyl-CoA synthetase (AMP-forming)/AMP-acid ligase II
MSDEAIGRYAERAADAWSNLEFAELDGRRITFGELSAWVNRVAGDFVSRGVAPGDRVLVQLPNSLEVIVLQLAAWRIGAVAVPVVPIYREREVSQIVRDACPAVVATTERLRDRHLRAELDSCIAAAAIDVKARYIFGDGADGWTAVPPAEGPDPTVGELPGPAQPDDCCLILYTSGTTSAPKGAMLSSAALIAATRAWERLSLGRDDVALGVAPLAHIAGMVPSCLVPLTVGCRVTILPRWDVDAAVEAIHRERATFSTGANVFLKDLVDHYERDTSRELRKLTYFVSGGAATPPSLVERATALGMGAMRAYGMTETAGVIAMAPYDASLERRACFDGRLLDDVEMRVVDAEGNDLPVGAEGSLLIRGPQLMLGYTDPAVNAAQVRDGWFDPGDIGALDADRWLRITGRTKDIINRGGEKFSARDIEEAILRHDAVADAAVVPIPDERFGEAVCAFIVIEDGIAAPGAEEIAGFMISSGIAKAKVPVEWHVVDRIPTTATGKIKKFELVALRAHMSTPAGAAR